MTFQTWTQELDQVIKDTIGTSLDDLADADTRQMFDDGFTPQQAAQVILMDEGLLLDVTDNDDSPATDAAGQCYTDADPGL
jgi:hypothetical protein